MSETKVSRYHIGLLSTNMIAMAVSLTFIQTYVKNGISVLPFLTIILGLCIIAITIGKYLLLPKGKIANLFPEKNFFFLNLAIILFLPLFFINSMTLSGYFAAMLFGFFIFYVEHLIYGGKA